MTDKLTIGLVLPDVLGTYGDDGNALVLRQRARMRGMEAEILPLRLGDAIPEGLDAYTLGGGEDVAQILAVKHLKDDGGLLRAAAAGRPVLAICAGLQVLGESFTAGGGKVDGLGLIDAVTSPQTTRTIGEVASTPLIEGITDTLTGFENHLGTTVLGSDASPLGRVLRGSGNLGTEYDEDDRVEGAYQGSVICTYMHGPALARNPQLADLILARATGVEVADLQPLDLPEIDRLRSERINSKPRPKSER